MINKKRLVDTFLDLVRIDSPSGEEKTIAEELIKRLEALGGKATRDSYGNIIGKFPGRGEPLMINAHMDTVEPGRKIKPVVTGDIISSDGTTILGGDCKAGLAIILETLASMKESNKTHAPLEVVFTRQEETGLLGAANLDYNLISAKQCITFDSVGPVSHIVTSAPHYTSIDIEIIGKSAHAGVEPEKGLSSIVIASEIITRLRLGRIDKNTTANIGLVHAGSVRNAVPEKLHAKGEIRSRKRETFASHIAHFQDTIAIISGKFPDAQIHLKTHSQLVGFSLPNNHAFVQSIENTLKAMNETPVHPVEGGLFDMCIFNMKNITAITLGMGMYNPHTTREYVKTSEIVQGAEFLERFAHKQS